MVKAFVIGALQPSKEWDVKEKAMNINGVKSFEVVYGKYDFIAEIEVDEEEDLNVVILDNIRKIEDVTKTQTLIVQKIIK